MREITIENEMKNRNLSIKGLVFSVLTTLGILIIQEIVNKYTKIRYLDTYFIIGWMLFPIIASRVYLKFTSDGENLISVIIIAILNFILPYVFYYFADALIVSVESGMGYYETLSIVPIYTYMSMVFYDDILNIQAIELTKNTLLLYHLVGLGFYIYFVRREIYRNKYEKTQNSAQTIENIAENMKAEIADERRGQKWQNL